MRKSAKGISCFIRFLQPSYSSAQQLFSLSQDILDASQLKAGKFQLNIEEFEIRELVKDIV